MNNERIGPMTPTRPSDPAVNEAAERLRQYMRERGFINVDSFIVDALATERRNTVERIRERVRFTKFDPVSATDAVVAFLRILDEVAS